jgi:hypothetical protein
MHTTRRVLGLFAVASALAAIGCGGGGGSGAKTPIAIVGDADVASCSKIGPITGVRQIGDDANDPIKRAARNAGATHIVFDRSSNEQQDAVMGEQHATAYKCDAAGAKDGG